MSPKNWLTVTGGAFMGGVTGWLAQGLAGGIPTTESKWIGFALGALIAGITGVKHLYDTAPPDAARASAAANKVLAIGLLVLIARTDAGCTPAQAVQGVDIGLNAAICVLNEYPAEIAAGKSEAQAIEGTAVKCGLSAVQTSGILDAHKKAESLEKAGR